MCKYFLFATIVLLASGWGWTQNEASRYQIIAANSKTVYIKGVDIRCFSNSDKAWQPIQSVPGAIRQELERANFAYDIATLDEKGNLWILLPANLLFYNKAKNSWIVYALPSHIKESQYPDTPVGIEVWKDGVWIALSEYLWCFHLDNPWWEQFSYPAQYNGGIIEKGPGNVLWLDGIAFFDGKSWETLPHCPIPLSFWPKTPQCFTWDRHGSPWVATVQGIYFFDMEYKCWRESPGKKMQKAYSIGCFQNEIWCTEYGDSLYKFAQDQWVKIESSSLYPRLPYTYALYATPSHLWVNTYFGIGSFDGNSWLSYFDASEFSMNIMILLALVIALLSLGIVVFLFFGSLRRRMELKKI